MKLFKPVISEILGVGDELVVGGAHGKPCMDVVAFPAVWQKDV